MGEAAHDRRGGARGLGLNAAVVMPAHAGIHVLAAQKDVDGRDKPGHDG
jgi:hypothetical protein